MQTLVGLDITWEITLVGLGSLLAGIGSFLAGYAALRRSKQEPPAKPPTKPEPQEDDWVKANEET